MSSRGKDWRLSRSACTAKTTVPPQLLILDGCHVDSSGHPPTTRACNRRGRYLGGVRAILRCLTTTVQESLQLAYSMAIATDRRGADIPGPHGSQPVRCPSWRSVLAMDSTVSTGIAIPPLCTLDRVAWQIGSSRTSVRALPTDMLNRSSFPTRTVLKSAGCYRLAGWITIASNWRTTSSQLIC